MLIFSTGLALTMAAYMADPIETAQKKFSNCLIDTVNEQLDAKAPQKTFEKAANAACEKEKAAFHSIVLKDERGYGSSQAEASQYADEEAQGIIDSFVQSYGDYVLNNSRPTKQ